MRRVILAESAGVCYGVRRAVKLAEETAALSSGGCRMLGDLIHNAHVVEDLARQGVRKVSGSGELTAEDTVIIRSHGELKSVLDDLEQRGIRCINATCPNVMRIQTLVAQAEQDHRRAPPSGGDGRGQLVSGPTDLRRAGGSPHLACRGRKAPRNPPDSGGSDHVYSKTF